MVDDSNLPILFLDVDGPLIPWDNRPSRRPDGYETFRWVVPVNERERDGMRRDSGRRRAWLRPSDGAALLQLPVRLVWATSWGHTANQRIGPNIGLPELPVATPVNYYGNRGRTQSWKVPDLLAFAGDTPFAWLDDEIFVNDVLYITSNARRSVLLAPVNARCGITSDDLNAIREWAEHVPYVSVPGVSVTSHGEDLLVSTRRR